MRPSRNKELIDALGLEIKARRLELDYSQEDLAGFCDLDRPYISLLEVGRRQPTLSVLHRIAGGLSLTFEEFAGRIERRYAKVLGAKKKSSAREPR
jgi:transcriptional regulator with XRE-family HTH domain